MFIILGGWWSSDQQSVLGVQLVRREKRQHRGGGEQERDQDQLGRWNCWPCGTNGGFLQCFRLLSGLEVKKILPLKTIRLNILLWWNLIFIFLMIAVLCKGLNQGFVFSLYFLSFFYSSWFSSPFWHLLLTWSRSIILTKLYSAQV